MSELEFRGMNKSAEDLQLFTDCFNHNGSSRELASVRWQFVDNPVGKLYVDLAVDSTKNRFAAIYASMPGTFKVGQSMTVAVQSLDTLTDKDFRGLGLFKKLANSVFERCDDDGVSFIYGFPNGNSVHGFFNRLGWTSLDPVPFLIRPLRSKYFLSKLPLPSKLRDLIPNIPLSAAKIPKIPPEDEIAVALSFDEFDVDAIWRAFAPSFRVGIQRDAQYLKWRMSKPGERYTTLVYYSAGVAQGFVTYAVKEKHGGRIGYVLEMMQIPGNPSVGSRLLSHMLRDMIRQQTDAVLAWCFSHSVTYQCYRSVGFMKLPEKLRPIELHMGARSFSAGMGQAIVNRENWYVSYCDSDTV